MPTLCLSVRSLRATPAAAGGGPLRAKSTVRVPGASRCSSSRTAVVVRARARGADNSEDDQDDAAAAGTGRAIVPFEPQGGKSKGLQRMGPGTGMEIVLHAARGEGAADLLKAALAGAGAGKSKGLQRMGPGTGMEIVLHAARGEGAADLTAPPSSSEEPFQPLTKRPSKRRTQQLKFTCNKCGEMTVRNVNPHALKAGTVFVQCGGCLVHHKLVDNLNLWDDMMGPQFVGDSTLYKRQQEREKPNHQDDLDWEFISRMRGFNVWDKLDDSDDDFN